MRDDLRGDLRFGYTLDDIDHITRSAIMANRSMAADWADRYDAAYFAVVEYLYMADVWPRWEELVRVGIKAISKFVRLELQHYGIDRKNMDRLAAGEKHKGFCMFWDAGHLHSPSHENYVVERIALRQVLAELSIGQRSMLAARAAYGDNGLAAQAVAKPRHSFVTQLGQARRAFRRLWFEGDAAPANWANDQPAPAGGGGTARQRAMALVRRRKREGSPPQRKSPTSDRCRRGHLRDETTTYVRPNGSRTCRICLYEQPSRRRRHNPALRGIERGQEQA